MKLKKISCLKFKKVLIFHEELPNPQKLKFIIFFQKKLRINFSKTLSDNSFRILYNLNQITLPVSKNIENHLFCQFFFRLLNIFYYISSQFIFFTILLTFSQIFYIFYHKMHGFSLPRISFIYTLISGKNMHKDLIYLLYLQPMKYLKS